MHKGPLNVYKLIKRFGLTDSEKGELQGLLNHLDYDETRFLPIRKAVKSEEKFKVIFKGMLFLVTCSVQLKGLLITRET